MSQSKIDELLDSVRQEFARLSQNADSYRLQNQKDYDFKINQQLAEMQQIRNTVYELELTHRKMKDDYDEELNRIKLELEQKDRQIQSLSMQNQQQQQYQQNQQQQLQIQQIQQQQQVAQQQQHTTSPPVIAATFPSQVNRPLLGNNNSQSSSSNTPTQQPPNIVPPSTQGATTLHPIGPPLPTTNANGTVTSPVLTNNAKTEPTQLYQPNVISSNQTTSPKPTLPQMNTAAIAPLNQTQLPPPPTVPAAAPASATVPVPATATTAAPATKVEEITPVIGTQTETNSNYLVPYNERSNNLKPIPPYLLDLDPTNALEKWKKVTQDYYILYNPALPRNLDVDLHMSFDHSSVVCCVRFSNDGQFLATGCNKTTQVYRVSDGSLVAKLSDDNAPSLQNSNGSGANGTNGKDGENNATSTDLYIRSVCFSPDGKFLATGAEDRLIRIWDIQKQEIVMFLQGHDQDVYSLDYFPSGDKLVSGSGDRTVRIWDLKTGQCSLTLSIEDGVTTVAVSPGDGKYIAAGSLDRAVRVWDSETGFLVERLDSENELGTGHRDSVYSVVFTKDGNKVVSGSLDRSVKLWNLRNAKENGKSNSAVCDVTYIGHKDFVLSVTTTNNDEYVLSGSKDRGVLFWDTDSGNPLLMLQGHRNSVISVAVANGHPLGPDYQVFATGSGDCRARIWKFSKTSNEGKIEEVKS